MRSRRELVPVFQLTCIFCSLSLSVFSLYQDAIQRGIHPQGMEECGFVILYERKKYYFSADSDRAQDMWCTAIKEYIQGCTSVVVKKRTSFDDTNPKMVLQLSIGEAKDMVTLDNQRAAERMAYFRMSVGGHVKRSKTLLTSKKKVWNQTFAFPISIEENPEIQVAAEECYSDGPYAMGKMIGLCSLPLSSFPPDEGQAFWACLRSSAHISSPIAGKVQVHILIKTKHEMVNGSEQEWETKNDVTVFEKESRAMEAAPVANGEAGGGSGVLQSLEIEEGGKAWKRKTSLLDLLCCGLGTRKKKEKDQKYELLTEMDDL